LSRSNSSSVLLPGSILDHWLSTGCLTVLSRASSGFQPGSGRHRGRWPVMSWRRKWLVIAQPYDGSENRLWFWLSSWLSSPRKVAGMDGNRTHPGRLNSAPQTVLKTAGLPSTDVHRGPLQFDRTPSDTRTVRHCPLVSVKLAVFLAVSDPPGNTGLLVPRPKARVPARAP
jgi:hypothetical protein